jgi:anaerobic selenocysteine-containing dehydrogenase
MQTIRTVCARDCYDTCTLLVKVDEANRIVSIKGDPNHPVTQGTVCPRGAADGKRRLKNRIDGPHRRKNGAYIRIGWDEALDRVSEKLDQALNRFGPAAVLHLDYSGNTGMITSGFAKRLWYAIGATRTDGAVCSRSGHAGLALHYGASYGQQPEAVVNQKLIVFWGVNAAVSFPHLWRLALKARNQARVRIVVIDPHRNQTAQKADLHLQTRPGTDVALAYGLLKFLIQNGHTDTTFINQWTRGFDQLAEAVDGWTLDKTAAATGIEIDRLKQLGNWYAESKPSLTHIGIGLQKNDRGADQARAVSFIPALLGLQRGFFYGNGSAWNIDNDLVSGRSLVDRNPKIIAQVAVADQLNAGTVKFVFISGMNPAVTLPNSIVLNAGLARRDVFSVVQDTHWTHTARMADLVLPVPVYLEKEDVIIPWTHRHINFSPQVAEPAVDCRTETVIMRAIARRLDRREAWLFEDPWPVVEAALADAFENGQPADLLSGRTLKLTSRSLQNYPTPSGRIEFVSQKAAAAGFDPLPIPSTAGQMPSDAGYILITSATRHYTHTQFQETYGPIPAVVEIHPHDAAELGISEGQAVVLENELGSLSATATITGRVLPGMLWCPRQFVDAHGRPQNSLMSSDPQQIGRGPRFNSTRVSVRAETG